MPITSGSSTVGVTIVDCHPSVKLMRSPKSPHLNVMNFWNSLKSPVALETIVMQTYEPSACCNSKLNTICRSRRIFHTSKINLGLGKELLWEKGEIPKVILYYKVQSTILSS